MLERQGAETQAFATENLRGIEKFRNDLPRTVQEINEQIDKIRFDKFMDRLQDAARMAEEIGDSFGRAAGNLVRDIKHPLDALKGLADDLVGIITQNFERQVSQWATQAIGGPVAKGIFGGQLTGPDALTVEQMNMALDLATGNLNGLAAAAAAASGAMGGSGAAGAADQVTGSFGQLDPTLASFGNRLMSLFSGGGGGGLGGILKGGMSLLGGLFGGGGGGLSDPGIGVLGQGSIANTNVDLSGLASIPSFDVGGWVGGGSGGSKIIRAHEGEHITNPFAASRFGPLLDAINSGMIADLPSLGRMISSRRDDDRNVIDSRIGGSRGMTQIFNVRTNNADSFRRSERQLRGLARRRLAMQ
jgi:hypothetical protein